MNTSIDEVHNKRALKVAKLDFGCDVEVNVPPPLPRKCGWFMIIAGCPGSGKSTMVNSLFCTKKKGYWKQFQDTFLFGNGTVSLKKDPFRFVPKSNRYDRVTEETLTDFRERIEHTGRRVLVVFDDVVSDWAFSAGVRAMMAELTRNRRHAANGSYTVETWDTRMFPPRMRLKTVRVTSGSVSIVITTQNFNAVPRQCRMIASHLILFACNESEKAHIAEELIAMPKKVFRAICRYTFKNAHDHLFVETGRSGLDGYYRNFNRLLIKYE